MNFTASWSACYRAARPSIAMTSRGRPANRPAHAGRRTARSRSACAATRPQLPHNWLHPGGQPRAAVGLRAGLWPRAPGPLGPYGWRVPNPLFSSYRAGENRVTSSTLAVFERIDLALIQGILASATGAGAELTTVTFENQVVNIGAVPDARISARFVWWFETKTGRGGYGAEGHDRDQLRQHSKQLEDVPEAWLFVLTPDPLRPTWFDELDGVAESVRSKVLWLGFRDLAEAISAVIGDSKRLVSKQTRFLLNELVALYEADGLLTNDDTVVVAARSAWPEYQQTSAYVCQPDRSFREGLTHLGFYADGAIQPLVPRIDQHLPSVPFTREEAESRRLSGDHVVAHLIDRLLDDGGRTDGSSYGVLLLSGPDDGATVVLDQPVLNDTVTATGRNWAWTLGQRYTRLDALTSGIQRTSEL